ncbi:MAG: glycosyltransferase family 2 protein [Candidatus Acidiferrales bacterium]
MNPTVTVLVDTYNHERFIEEALVSVVEQEFPAAEMEIIVVDDGSTDRTPEIVRKFAPRVRLLRKSNGGQASAFNFGIPEAHGEIVAFLDGDDWWARNKLARVTEAMAADPEVGIIGHGIVEVDAASKHLRTLIPRGIGPFNLRTDEGAQIFRSYMAFLGTSRVSICKSVLLRILPIPETLVIEADEFMSAAALSKNSGLLVPEPLTFYRLHEGNLFHFGSGDPARLRRKQKVLSSLEGELSQRLRGMGISASAILIVIEPIRVAALRLKLSLDGGTRREAYSAEKADLHHAYQHLTAGYLAWKRLSLALALVLPPRQYYKLRELYAAFGLRRFRSWLGEPKPRAEINELRPHSGEANAER